MTGAIDDIRFLADSAHRPVVLATLSEGPHTRADLRAVTGASSATIGRLVQAFEERGWLERDGSTYALTALGAFVADRFSSLHRDMNTARELEALLSGLPLDEIGIGVERLTDARITRATPSNPFAVVSRVRELELDSATAFSLTDFFPEPCIDARYEAIVEGHQHFDAVFAPVVLEAAMVSPAADKFEAMVACERANVYRYDDPIECPVMFHDGEGCLIVRNDEGVTVGLIETADEMVVDWVQAVFDAHRNAATPVAMGDLQPLRPDTAAEA